MSTYWIGVIVEDGLRDVSVLEHVGILEKRQKELGISGIWTIIEVSVKNEDFKKVTELLEKGLRKAWYAYFKQGKEKVIVFKNKTFKIKSAAGLTRVKNWAFKTYNIMPEVFSLNL